MKQTKYFRTHDEGQAFAAGLHCANTGHIHSLWFETIEERDSFQFKLSWHDENKTASELPEKHPPLTPAEYVEYKGDFCPMCRGFDFTGHSIEVADGQAFQEVTCNNPDCEASWVDCYELSGYDKLER